MKKVLFILISLFILVGLSACDDGNSEEKEVSSVDSSNKNDNEENAEQDEAEDNEESDNDVEEVEEVIADDDYIKATLTSIEHVEDETFDEEKYVINIDLENKTDDKITVQARDTSIDGTMVDDMVFFSEEIAGDKKANGKMEIQNYEGDLPEMANDIEFTLVILEDETFESLSEHDVKVDF